MAQPLLGAGERAGVEMTDMGAPAHLAPNQAGAFQRLDVLGCRGERHGEGLRQLPDGALPVGQVPKHIAPGRVAKRVEDGIEPGRIKFNHVVEYVRPSQ